MEWNSIAMWFDSNLLDTVSVVVITLLPEAYSEPCQ